MPKAALAVARPPEQNPNAATAPQSRMTELKVSGHLMMLETGLFAVFQPPGSPAAGANGLPGVRISLPPGPMRRPDAVRISTFREDGWMGGADGALVRVAEGPAHVLVTIYQAPGAPPESAPQLQVTRLSGEPVAAVAGPAPALAAVPVDAEVVAHVQRTGDVGGALGEWVGVRGSKLWIEGFGITPRDEIASTDIEYQAVLGRGWLSPWVEGGKFCGSRGMALPLLGLRVRMKGAAAETHECSYSATFVDGSAVGPIEAGGACEAASLAGLEAFQIVLRRRDGESGAKGVARTSGTKPMEATRKPRRVR
jgi:Clostridial hydrophobic W